MDLTFHVRADWNGVGKEGEGKMQAGGQDIAYSAPASMGGKGVGTNPEELLLSGVTACYSGTLMRILSRQGLPGSAVTIDTEGLITDYPGHAVFSGITVNPTIVGGDPSRLQDYEAAAESAREQCFIGRVVRDYLRYAVGKVMVQ